MATEATSSRPAAAAAAPGSGAGLGPTRGLSTGYCRWDWWAVGALGAVLATGMVVRGLVVFGGDLPRGINGGYYPLQVRTLFSSGRLGFPDFPLLFYLQAAAAVVIGLFQADRGQAIILATQVTDTVLPCLMTVPLFLLARAWVPAERRANLPVVVLSAGLAAVLSPNALRMAGDLQKNAAALAPALLFVYFADWYLRSHRLGPAVGALASLAVTGLTHLGGFAMTALVAGFMGALALASHPNRRRLLPAAGGALLVCATVGFTIFAWFDPTRMARLTGYLLAPWRLLRIASPQPGGGPPGGPPGMPGLAMIAPEAMAGLLLGAMGVWMWLLLLDAERQQRATALGCSLAALVLACPWFNPDLRQRLSLMAFAPGLVALVFALAHWPRVWGCVVAGGAVAAIALAAGLQTVRAVPPGSLSRDARAELGEIAARIPNPRRTLVVARHGLEWWVAWFTKARVANNLKAALSGWDEYEQVLSLTEIGGPQSPSPGLGAPGGAPPGPRGPPPWLGQNPGLGPRPPGDNGPSPPGAPAWDRGEPPGFGSPAPVTGGEPGLPGGRPDPSPDRRALPGSTSAWANPFRPAHPPSGTPASRPGPDMPWPGGQPGTDRQGFGGGPGADASPSGRGARTEPVFSGKALRLERFLEKPPLPPVPDRPGGGPGAPRFPPRRERPGG